VLVLLVDLGGWVEAHWISSRAAMFFVPTPCPWR